jgi:hypothetical protein
MKNLIRIKSFLTKKHPRQSFIYAITAGKYLGELLVYVEKDSFNYNFLVLPDMDIRKIPIDKFDSGIESGIVDIVEQLPAYVFKTCMQQYNKNKTKVLALEDTED